MVTSDEKPDSSVYSGRSESGLRIKEAHGFSL